jgi:hypothetical protein
VANLRSFLNLTAVDLQSFFIDSQSTRPLLTFQTFRDRFDFAFEVISPNSISLSHSLALSLSRAGKQCTIYEARPLQCSTYPWWPKLLANEAEYLEEAVDPIEVEDGKVCCM